MKKGLGVVFLVSLLLFCAFFAYLVIAECGIPDPCLVYRK